jgi:hypothetical protein
MGGRSARIASPSSIKEGLYVSEYLDSRHAWAGAWASPISAITPLTTAPPSSSPHHLYTMLNLIHSQARIQAIEKLRQ